MLWYRSTTKHNAGVKKKVVEQIMGTPSYKYSLRDVNGKKHGNHEALVVNLTVLS